MTGRHWSNQSRKGVDLKNFTFTENPFGSSESLVTFMNALRGDEHLERLHVPNIDVREVTQALAAALHENKGLIHLTVSFPALDDSCRAELSDAISLHPSLRSLDLKMDRMNTDPKKRRGFTKAVADMLSVNERIEVMPFYHYWFNKDDWDAFVKA
jgi:hypothetical protein